MSLSSTSSATGPRPARAVTAVAVMLAVLAPLAVLCAQVWTGTQDSLSFTGDERRGADYLGPLTELLGATTAAQSAAVAGRPVDPAAIRAAVAAVDRVDARLGGRLGTSDRWQAVRRSVLDRITRKWPVPTVAYAQYSDVTTALLQLNRTVGDNSRLILDPSIDTYYVMSATLLRIPDILVDSGRYADLSVLSTPSGSAGSSGSAGEPDAAAQAQLAAARNRIASDETDLSNGLLKAFGRTGSSTLGPGLTRQLDNFSTAVDAVAPSSSLLAPVPTRSASDLAADHATLLQTALDLQRAALGQLDLLLAARERGDERTRLVALAATAVGVLVAVGLATLVWRRPAARPAPAGEPAPPDLIRPAANGSRVVVRAGGARAAR